MRKMSINALILLIVVFVVFYALVRYLEGTVVFFPSHNMTLTPAQVHLPYEDVYMTTSDGVKINGWFLKNPRGSSTILFAHGNAGTISDRLMKTKFFYDLGFNVFVFDYRGYGKSEGRPSEKGIYLDALAAYDYLQSRGDVNMAHIVLYGASLGGVVVIDLAGKRPVAALVVDSSLTSAQDMAKVLYPMLPSFLMTIKFDSITKIKTLTMPKLFIHSPEDRVVPFAMGRRLFEAAPEPKEFLQVHGGHNDAALIVDHEATKSFVQFLDRFQISH